MAIILMQAYGDAGLERWVDRSAELAEAFARKIEGSKGAFQLVMQEAPFNVCSGGCRLSCGPLGQIRPLLPTRHCSQRWVAISPSAWELRCGLSTSVTGTTRASAHVLGDASCCVKGYLRAIAHPLLIPILPKIADVSCCCIYTVSLAKFAVKSAELLVRSTRCPAP